MFFKIFKRDEEKERVQKKLELDKSRRTLLKSMPFLAAIPITATFNENEVERQVKLRQFPELKFDQRYLFVVDASEDARSVRSLIQALHEIGITGIFYPTNNPDKAIQIYELNDKASR